MRDFEEIPRGLGDGDDDDGDDDDRRVEVGYCA
jgi:hypothetical protein